MSKNMYYNMLRVTREAYDKLPYKQKQIMQIGFKWKEEEAECVPGLQLDLTHVRVLLTEKHLPSWYHKHLVQQLY